MKLRKVDWVVLGGAVLVVLLVSWLPSPRDHNPPVPSTKDHVGIMSTTQCITCHANEGSQPLTVRHPKRQDCFRCHREPTIQAVSNE